MKVTVIALIIGELEMVPNGLVREMEGTEIGAWSETIQTLLKSPRLRGRFQET